MSSSNCCFLTCIQISQEADQVVWYSHLFQNFPQFIVIHTGFGIVNKAEIDVFLELSCFLDDPAIWSLVPLPFLKPAWTSGSSLFTYCWSLAWTDHRRPKTKKCFFSILFSLQQSPGPQHNSATPQQMIQGPEGGNYENSLLEFVRIIVWLIGWNSMGLGKERCGFEL